jgi:prophage DNA circulation protein
MNMQTNIDDVRAEIMRLENEKVFDQRAWANVLGQLSNSPSRRQDAVRRMMTAKQNATAILEQPHRIGYSLVAMETVNVCDMPTPEPAS